MLHTYLDLDLDLYLYLISISISMSISIPVHGFVVLFFGSLKVGGLKLFPLHFGFLFRVLGKLILGYTFPIDRFYETKSEQTKHNEKLDETCIHNTYNIHVFMQMV